MTKHLDLALCTDYDLVYMYHVYSIMDLMLQSLA